MWKNTAEKFGLVSKLLHWLSAITVFSMFALGFWMVDLTYYSQWYQTAPHWHESVGILLLIATTFRLIWRFVSPPPKAIPSHASSVQQASKLAHLALYILLFSLLLSGYFISTADGRGIEVFNWFSVIGFQGFIDNQEDIAGLIHEYLAYILVALSLLHGAAAIKHHLIDKDQTLTRMLK